MYFDFCAQWVDKEETFPEVGGCQTFKRKDAFVEVVRCKDCKCAYINSFSAASGVAVCKKWSNEAETAIVQHDDFCSHGERKDND